MATFEQQIRPVINKILEQWATAETAAAKRRLLQAGLKNTGLLLNSIRHDVVDAKNVTQVAEIFYYYTGTIQDRKFIGFEARGKGVHTDNLISWIEEKGIQNFEVRGNRQFQTRDDEIRDIAWRIRKRWELDGGRQGRPWNFRNTLEQSAFELMAKIEEAYATETIEGLIDSYEI